MALRAAEGGLLARSATKSFFSVSSGGLRVLRVKVLLIWPRTNADGAITTFRLPAPGSGRTQDV